MSRSTSLVAKVVPVEERQNLDQLLEDSFESWYLWHSRKILRSVDYVEKATLDGVDVGLVMLKMLDTDVGYVYYVAVSKVYRRQGVGGFLVERAIEYFSRRDANEIFAAVEEDNEPSIRLFQSRGFQKMRFSQLSKKYGRIKAARLWAGMFVVSGEVVFSRFPWGKAQLDYERKRTHSCQCIVN